MEIIMIFILLFFGFLYYIFNKIMRYNINIKEDFLELNSFIQEKIDLSEKIEKEYIKDNNLNNIIKQEDKNLDQDIKKLKKTKNKEKVKVKKKSIMIYYKI